MPNDFIISLDNDFHPIDTHSHTVTRVFALIPDDQTARILIARNSVITVLLFPKVASK